MERQSLLLAKCGRENSTAMSPSKTSLGMVIEDSSMRADEPSLNLESLLRLSFSSPQVEKAHSTHDRLGTRSRSVVFNQGVAATTQGERIGGEPIVGAQRARFFSRETLFYLDAVYVVNSLKLILWELSTESNGFCNHIGAWA
jgi:hypothetical protein